MRAQFNLEEFNLAKSNELLPCECYHCHKVFYKTKYKIHKSINPNSHNKGMYCSKQCQSDSQITKINTCCSNCNKNIDIKVSFFKKSKSDNHFCSRSCAATYNNKHKTTGNRRSKLEKHLETELIKLYPDLEIQFNRKDAINSELDIYMPSLKLAFELNGIFHYEPIYGQDKLDQIQNNDNRKFQACLENNIELCIIDSSKETYMKKEKCDKYVQIITNIINNKLSP